MKKIVKIGLLIISIVLISGCTSKAITAEEFKERLTSAYYRVEEKDEHIDSSILTKEYAAISNTGNYEIIFYEFVKEKNAKEYFSILNYLAKDDAKRKIIDQEDIEIDNNKKLVINTYDTYYYIVRSKNTVIYAETYISYKEEVNAVIQDLG